MRSIAPLDPAHILDEDESTDLSAKGIEHFKTRLADKKVTVYYGEVPYQLARGTYTTEQLIGAFSVDAGDVLDLITHDGKFVELKPGAQLRIKEGMHFASQVVWPNGVLASTAVGLFTQLVCTWHKKPMETAYLEYDGNKHTVTASRRLEVLHSRECEHHPKNEIGEPGFDIRKAWQPTVQKAGNEQVLKKGWVQRMIARLIQR